MKWVQHEKVQNRKNTVLKKMNQGKSAAWKNTTCKKFQNEMITIQEGAIGN